MTETNPLPNRTSIYDLLIWKNMNASALSFLSISLGIMFIQHTQLITGLLFISWVIFASVLFLEITGNLLYSKGFVSNLKPDSYITISRDAIDPIAEQVVLLVNSLLVELQRVVYVDDIRVTVLVFIITSIAYVLLQFLSILSILLLLTVAAFTIPVTYVNNKTVVDDYCAQLCGKRRFADLSAVSASKEE